MFDGERRRHFAVGHEVREAGHGAIGEAQQAFADALLELGVVAATLAARRAAPGCERFRVHHGDDFGRVEPVVARFRRGERQICVARLAGECPRRFVVEVVVIERRVDPIVLAVDAERRNRRLQTQVEIDCRHAAAQRFGLGALSRGQPPDLALGRQQPLIGERRADVGDDDGGAIADGDRLGAAAVERVDADGAAVLDHDRRRLVADADRAACRFDARLDRARDAPGAAGREPAAVEIAAGDQGVEGEGALLGRQSVVAPLGGDERLQFGRTKVVLEIFGGGLRGSPRAERAQQAHEIGERRRHQLLLDGQDMPARGRHEVAEIAADRCGFIGVALDESRFVALRVRGNGEAEVRVDEALEVVGHPVPVERAAGQEVEQTALEPPFVHVAEVMQADVPRGAVAAERVRLPAALAVLFQHQHFAPADASQEPRGSEAAHPRSDDDRVPVLVHGGVSWLSRVWFNR